MVFYVYENGSRARKVALEFLKNFCGFLSTDGYVAYSIFDDAENAAFMFSVTESCSLNGINPESYLEDVFRSILFGTNRDRRDFLPCYYQWHEMPKMTGLEVAKLLSTAA
jgi:hypothetical protein